MTVELTKYNESFRVDRMGLKLGSGDDADHFPIRAPRARCSIWAASPSAAGAPGRAP